MRRSSTTALAVLAGAFLGISASASRGAVLVSDSFPYADGNLVGNVPAVGGTWAAHSGAGATPVQVSGGKISLAQGSGSREDVNSTFDGGFTLGALGKLYAAFDLSIADPGAAITDVYFASFLQGASNFDARIWVTAPTAGGSGYRLAISNDNSITDADGEVFTDNLAFGQTYTIVTRYDYDAKQGTLWIDPSSEAGASISAADPGFSDASVAYAFRQAGGNTTQVIDNLKVGTTFGDVVAGAPVPEPASLGLIALGTLPLLGRRGRRA